MAETTSEIKPATFQNIVRFLGDLGFRPEIEQLGTNIPNTLERVVKVPFVWRLKTEIEERFGEPLEHHQNGERYEAPSNGHKEVTYLRYIREPF